MNLETWYCSCGMTVVQKKIDKRTVKIFPIEVTFTENFPGFASFAGENFAFLHSASSTTCIFAHG